MRTRIVSLFGVLLLIVALQSCGSDDDDFHYVSLGDSYTSAPGVPEASPGTVCGRSTNNYPAILAKTLGRKVKLTDVSCGGAESQDMWGHQSFGTVVYPPQLDALRKDTDLVTVGIGANDYRFFAAMLVACTTVAPQDPDGSPCKKGQTANGIDILAPLLADITDNVAHVVGEIEERSPDAQILVINYPQLIPESGTCPDLLPLATDDYPYVRNNNKRLSEAVAAGAKAGGAELVDVYAASLGHDICADDPWVQSVKSDDEAFLFHPFAEEQKAVAGLIKQQVD